MNAYKATYNRRCKTIQYEAGKTYTFNGEIELCKQGFHFCEKPLDTLTYYSMGETFILMEIEVLGKVIKKDMKCTPEEFLEWMEAEFGKECKDNYIKLSNLPENKDKDYQVILDMAMAETFPTQLKMDMKKFGATRFNS
jgi:hypothetical protein